MCHEAFKVSFIQAVSMATSRLGTNYFVDLQGFKINRKFVLKELSIVSEHEDKVHNFIFKPPFSWENLSQEDRSQSIWLRTFYHGFSWKSGVVPYDNIPEILNTLLSYEDAVVYVKGYEKIGWLNWVWLCKGGRSATLGRRTVHIENIEELGCPTFTPEQFEDTDRYRVCGKHRSVKNCAHQKVLLMKDWYKNTFKQLNPENE